MKNKTSTQVTVTCCGNCVFHTVATPYGVSECRHPNGNDRANIDASVDGAAPPEWCPLRKASVEIKLADVRSNI